MMIRVRGALGKVGYSFLVLIFFLTSLIPVSPGAVTKEEATRELAAQTDMLRKGAPAFPEAEPKPVVEEEDETLPPEEEGPAFLVRKISVEGNTLIASEKLLARAPEVEGRKVTLSELRKFAAYMTALYRAEGYTTTRAYIPPQKIVDGAVTVQILEGRVGAVDVEGNRWFRKSAYRNAVTLVPGSLFEMSELERSLREINAAPDRSARAFLAPGAEKGTTDVTLKAEDHFPIHASYEFNLRGTSLTHWARHILHVTDNNLSGFGDRLEASLSMAEQGALLATSVHYEFPWARTGTTYYFDGGVARSRLQKDLRELEVKGESFSLAPGVLQNFLATGRYRLDGDLRFEIKDSKTDIGNNKLSYDRMRVLVGGPRLTVDDRWGRTFFLTDVHVGIPEIMGGSGKKDDSATRVNSGGQFVYGTMNASRLQRLYKGSFLVLQGAGQLSATPLTALEQFYLGGMYSVRGYPESDSSGDRGYSFSAELRVPSYFVPASWKVPGMKHKTLRDALTAVGFVEGGQVFNMKRQQAVSEKNRTLLGTGFGFRFYASPDLNAQVDMGFPFGDTSTEKDKPQIHLSVRAGF